MSEKKSIEYFLNKIHCEKISEYNALKQIPDNSVNLIITSPPYNVGKEYENVLSLNDYVGFLHFVWQQSFRILCDGGRLCINIANTGRSPYIPLHAFIITDVLSLGFLMRGEIIWNKGASVGSSTAWGSWKSPSNPTLRDVHEYILVFSKNNYKLNKKGNSTLTSNEFTTLTKSIWDFSTVSARHVGHPAPFPIELPKRLINLYSFENDIVLDPFVGSGTTCQAAKMLNRKWIGIDAFLEYCKLSSKNLENCEIINYE
jgi:site-specific DNA-methyltransferase (adenine-specific)